MARYLGGEISSLDFAQKHNIDAVTCRFEDFGLHFCVFACKYPSFSEVTSCSGSSEAFASTPDLAVAT